jgi:hypothetical protein
MAVYCISESCDTRLGYDGSGSSRIDRMRVSEVRVWIFASLTV